MNGKTEHLEKARATLLKAAVPNVVFDGWSEALLRRAAEEVGIDSGLVTLACPRGALDLAAAFHREGDAQLKEQLGGDESFDALRIREKITKAVRERLEIAGPHKEAVRRASAMYALPHLAPEGAKLVWETADLIWNLAGDTAEDYNRYTKRLTLSGVFSATLLFWLNDESEDHEASWQFLDRRIENVMQFEKTKAKARGNPLIQSMMQGPEALLNRLAEKAGKDTNPGPGVGFPGRSSR